MSKGFPPIDRSSSPDALSMASRMDSRLRRRRGMRHQRRLSGSFPSLRALHGSLSIGLAKHQSPMESFEGPVIIQQSPSKEIQQLRMRRRSSSRPKIIGGAHQTFAKMVLPDPIDHHPGCQWVVRRDDGEGQSLTRWVRGEGIGRHRTQGGEKSRFHDLGPIQRVAPAKHVIRFGVGRWLLLEHHRPRG